MLIKDKIIAAITSSIGSVSVVDMQVGLTGLSSTFAIGSVTVNDMAIGNKDVFIAVVVEVVIKGAETNKQSP